MKFASCLLVLIDNYNEKGIFIRTQDSIIWFNGKRYEEWCKLYEGPHLQLFRHNKEFYMRKYNVLCLPSTTIAYACKATPIVYKMEHNKWIEHDLAKSAKIEHFRPSLEFKLKNINYLFQHYGELWQKDEKQEWILTGNIRKKFTTVEFFYLQ